MRRFCGEDSMLLFVLPCPRVFLLKNGVVSERLFFASLPEDKEQSENVTVAPPDWFILRVVFQRLFFFLFSILFSRV